MTMKHGKRCLELAESRYPTVSQTGLGWLVDVLGRSCSLGIDGKIRNVKEVVDDGIFSQLDVCCGSASCFPQSCFDASGGCCFLFREKLICFQRKSLITNLNSQPTATH